MEATAVPEAKQQPCAIIQDHKQSITAFAPCNLSSDTVLASSCDGSLSVLCKSLECKSDGWRCIQLLSGHTDRVQDVKIVNDDRLALSASWDTTIREWDLTSGTTVRTFEGHTGAVQCLSLLESAGPWLLVSGSDDTTVRIWDRRKPTSVETFPVSFPGGISSLMCTPGFTLVAGAGGRMIRLFKFEYHTGDASSDCVEHAACVQPGFATSISLSPDGSLLSSCDDLGNVATWDYNALVVDDVNPEPLPLWTWEHGCRINSGVFCPARFWFTVAADHGVRTMNIEYKELAFKLAMQDESMVLTLHVSAADADMLRCSACNLAGSEVLAWDSPLGMTVRDAEMAISTELRCPRIAIFSDSDVLPKEAFFEDHVNSSLIVKLQKKTYEAVEWNSDGKDLFVGASDGSISIYSSDGFDEDGRPIR